MELKIYLGFGSDNLCTGGFEFIKKYRYVPLVKYIKYQPKTNDGKTISVKLITALFNQS